MPKKLYVVTLTADERSSLQKLIATGKAAARKRLHAQILLKADPSTALADILSELAEGAVPPSVPAGKRPIGGAWKQARRKDRETPPEPEGRGDYA